MVRVSWSKTLIVMILIKGCRFVKYVQWQTEGKSQSRSPITYDGIIHKELLWKICNSSSRVLKGSDVHL